MDANSMMDKRVMDGAFQNGVGLLNVFLGIELIPSIPVDGH
jgi:hypothetical protein